MLKNIKIEDYLYPLPEERIARFPLERRDDSRLLVYTESSGESPVSASFKDISRFLPSGGVMVFNETKVVPARMFFQRPTGAIIEIFCLEPHTPSDYQLNFAATASCQWKVIVGNLKKWKGDTLSLCNPDNDSAVSAIDLKAELVEKEGNTCIVRFLWSTGISFSEVLSHCGRIPIPPYLKRETQEIDLERYQTLYAKR
ncbi:MAG: S-adenosylmethionine:tRNA ribosyltransferase-isomerase, partial [Bacteroidales bacterium]|nr:S-adenosylmethionine:tRNA ribosyltransferase-isomerase [Bacteroidales bacterium]